MMSEADAIALHGEAAVSTAAQHALWRAGDLTWMLHDGVAPTHNGQLKLDRLIDDAYARGIRRFVDDIGRRWGKSHYFVVRAFRKCLRKPRTRIPYAASTFTSLRQFILPIVYTVCETAPADLRPEVVDNEVRFHNGSLIPMSGCEDRAKANRLRGPAADEAIVDEAAFISDLEYVLDAVMGFQLGTTDGMLLIGSSPPESPSHHYTKVAATAKARGAYMHATIHDSPFVTPAAAAKLCNELGGPDSTAWQREALALHVVDQKRAIIPEFSEKGAEDDLVIEVPRPQHFKPCAIGDLGFVDLTCVLFGYHHFTSAATVIEGELFLERATSDVVQTKSREVEVELWEEREVVVRKLDGTARELADMARFQELSKDNEVPEPSAWWRTVNNRDLLAGVNAVRVGVKGRKIYIHPRCTTLIAHLKFGIWNKARTDFERSEGLGHFDGVAALIYFERHVDRSNPYPAPAFDRQTQHVPAGLGRPTHPLAALTRRPVRR